MTRHGGWDAETPFVHPLATTLQLVVLILRACQTSAVTRLKPLHCTSCACHDTAPLAPPPHLLSPLTVRGQFARGTNSYYPSPCARRSKGTETAPHAVWTGHSLRTALGRKSSRALTGHVKREIIRACRRPNMGRRCNGAQPNVAGPLLAIALRGWGAGAGHGVDVERRWT